MKTVVLLIVLMSSFARAGASETKTRGPLELRADRYVDAAVVTKVAGDTSVEALKTEAGWVQVRAAGQVGWVRATGLIGDGATVAALARLDSGRSASGNLVVAAGIRRVPKASKHALIITIESLGARRWPGVSDDRVAGRLIAGRLGVPDENVVDAEGSTLASLMTSLQAINDRVQPGDRLLVYFSGPGTQVVEQGACVAAWALADGTLSAARLVAALEPALVNADKTLFVVDAAYANGAAARKVVPSTCPAGNAASGLSLVAAAVATGVAQQNVVAMQSAGADQGLDVPRAGGSFTQALTDCVMGDAVDTDGSASISVAELATCVNARGRGGLLAAVTGNAGWSPIVGVSSTRVVAGTASPRAAIDDVLAQRDGRIDVALTATPSTLRIGRDFLGLTLTSSRAGFVYLVLLGSDGKSFYLLFPNDLDRDNRIAAGETMRLPRPGWQVQGQGPAGRDTVLAIVAESERDLAPFAARREGPFGTALTDGEGRAQLQWLLGQAGSGDCVGGGARRNLAAVRVCSDAFGAATVEVVEQ